MVGTLIKQPNEKYCVVDFAGEVRHYNLTEQDIINMYIEDAKACIGSSEHYGNLISRTINNSANGISDDVLKEMGFNKTYNELTKFVPRKPINQSYSHCDFATYGNCPHCGKTVINGMGWLDKHCKCGQLLKW